MNDQILNILHAEREIATGAVGNEYGQSSLCWLYYVKILVGDTTVYKIGITKASIKMRYENEQQALVTPMCLWCFPRFKDAAEAELRLLSLFRHEHRYTSKKILNFGNTELFTRDILDMHNDLGNAGYYASPNFHSHGRCDQIQKFIDTVQKQIYQSLPAGSCWRKVWDDVKSGSIPGITSPGSFL